MLAGQQRKLLKDAHSLLHFAMLRGRVDEILRSGDVDSGRRGGNLSRVT